MVWAPQPGPQKALIDCPLPEILYGGARGGGKTDGILGKYAIKAGRYGAGFNGVFFRREMPQQDDLIDRSRDIYGKLGSVWHEQKKMWVFPNGARLRFRPLENAQDAEKYQGQNLSDAAVEEAGNYPDPAPIDRLFGCLRSAHGVPTQLILTANPGGAGHHWIRHRYIDPSPGGFKVLERKLRDESIHRYVYIPAKVSDNRILTSQDPGYVSRLHLVGSDALVRAWLDGDWSVIEGAYFDCWSHKIVIRPCELPEHWSRFRAFDWGSQAPFSVGWWAIASEDFKHEGGEIPKNALVRYREWYGANNGVGLKMTAEEVAAGIKQREPADEKIHYSIADPSIFAEDGGPSIAERMQKYKILWKPADNKRVAGRGRLGGWDQMRQRMKAGLIFCFSTCIDSIRTIPALQHDALKPEDVNTDGEDHAADEWRYACMSRVIASPTPITQRPQRDRWDNAFEDDSDELQNWKVA